MHRDLYDPIAKYDHTRGLLVPDWYDSPDAAADAADQARWDRQEGQR